MGSAIWRGLRNRSNTYSFALRAFPTPFAHVLALIYFGVGSRGERPLAHAVYNKYIKVCRSSDDLCHEEAFESGLNFWFATSPAIGPDMAREVIAQA